MYRTIDAKVAYKCIVSYMGKELTDFRIFGKDSVDQCEYSQMATLESFYERMGYDIVSISRI